MKRRMICLLVLLLLFGLSPPASAGPIEEVRESVREFIKAYNDGNAEALASFYAENAVWVPGGGPFRIEGRAAIQGTWTGFFQRNTVRLAVRQPEFRAYGENVVASNSYYTFIAIDKASGKATVSHGRASVTRLKVDGKWLIINHHGSNLPASP